MSPEKAQVRQQTSEEKWHRLAVDFHAATICHEESLAERSDAERKIERQKKEIKRIEDLFASAVGPRITEKIYQISPLTLVVVRLVDVNVEGRQRTRVEVKIRMIEPKE